jgi:hypothetical protein
MVRFGVIFGNEQINMFLAMLYHIIFLRCGLSCLLTSISIDVIRMESDLTPRSFKTLMSNCRNPFLMQGENNKSCRDIVRSSMCRSNCLGYRALPVAFVDVEAEKVLIGLPT